MWILMRWQPFDSTWARIWFWQSRVGENLDEVDASRKAWLRMRLPENPLLCILSHLGFGEAWSVFMSQRSIFLRVLLVPCRRGCAWTKGRRSCCFSGFYFTVGLRFPCDKKLFGVLDRFQTCLHQLTPNALVQLSKFIWVVTTFGSDTDVDSFVRFHKLHPQKCKVTFNGDRDFWTPVWLLACYTFVPHWNNGKLKILKTDLSYCCRNLDLKYWFYVTVGFVESQSSKTVPFACKMETIDYVTLPHFVKWLEPVPVKTLSKNG